MGGKELASALYPPQPTLKATIQDTRNYKNVRANEVWVGGKRERTQPRQHPEPSCARGASCARAAGERILLAGGSIPQAD